MNFLFRCLFDVVGVLGRRGFTIVLVLAWLPSVEAVPQPEDEPAVGFLGTGSLDWGIVDGQVFIQSWR